MISKKVKKVIAQLLLVAFILPNVPVKAITNDSPESKVESTVTTGDKVEATKGEEKVDTSKVTDKESNETTEGKKEDTEKANNEGVKSEEEENTEEKNNDTSSKKPLENAQVEEKDNDSTKTDSENAISDEKDNKTSGSVEETVSGEESLKGKTYSKRKAYNLMARSSIPNIIEEDREEFRLKQEAIENLEVLVPMTDKEYELTIANADGSYEFLSAYDDESQAVNAAKSISESDLKSTQQPAVINSRGQVVYTTNQMARILRYVNNVNSAGNVNIYSDSSLKNAVTYINQGYVEDAPILDISGNSAKIMVNGLTGWINNNKSSGTYDMVMVPLKQVKNPSYYTVSGGELVHFISYDMLGTSGFSKTIGKAPSYLKEGVRYLSYDGQYFYQYDYKKQSSIESTLNKLINDYKSGVRNNAVNKNNAFYLYYLNLPFRSQTIYSAADLNNFINTYPSFGSGSKLKNLGQSFKDAEKLYGVNALLALGVAINESGFGNSEIAKNKNNLFGLNAVDSSPGQSADSFATPKDSVIDFAKNWISRGYSDPADWRYFGGFLGNKNRGANVKYASDPFWGEKAAGYAYLIDKTLSGGTSNLKDTNSKQIGMARSTNKVIKKNGTLLYNVTNDTNQYGGYINTPFVISNMQKVTISGKSYYEIYPERNTPVGSGGPGNKYHGNYNWSDRGYIEAKDISLVNVYVPPIEVKYGINRYATAVELSKSSFNSAETVVLANGYAIPDGLTATPMASYLKAPLLLTEKGSIPSATQNEIKRLGAKNVIIVGGTGVITSAVEKQLNKLGVTKITRLGGINRYETSLQVAKYIDSNLYDVDNVVIANGYGEADALSIAPVSGRDNMPIILVESNSIPSNVNSWLKSENLNNAYLIGGTGVLTNNVLNKINSMTKQNISGNRLGGANRYETNAKVIEKFYGKTTNKVYVTEGLQLADALTSGPVAALNGSPIVLAEKQLTYTQKVVLDKMTTNTIVQVGGTVSKTAVNNLRELLSRTK
ncbi:MAG: cell wall-binding repeat-containing protein [Clostridium sp.]|uniref:cell wall-binding repeat-containing protein n=1 Tax=Clostridium sp. TaxID=1506 RepID=UPI002911FE1E|nr:cell wall-binding repeat-containing protein [Clostridium sp.]MDU5111130.1 cell wall-binding repeat-containing protein [Clostridium sp.]